jgi:uncharacterized protein (DUF362 family)
VPEAASASVSDLYWVKEIPDQPFWGGGDGHYHAGVDSLLQLMGANGLKFYRSAVESVATGPQGMIASDDVVLIKVNAQWKHRGCTNSDLIRGLVRRVLDHPDGFKGEAVIVENGQGRGSLDCDTSASYGGDRSVQANANDPSHSFRFVAETLLADSRVSLYLLDPIRQRFIQGDDHDQDGYRRFENVSYPCFTTRNGTRVELWEGIWDGSGHRQNLKLINVPVLKHHDTGGSEITGALKHFYGLVSMADGHGAFRHYRGLGQTCGKMVASIRTPVLNIMDAIWVSQGSITGYPAETTTRVNQLLAGQDPVALDYWAAGHILYPIDGNRRHHPSFSGIQRWLKAAKKIINGRGGLYDPAAGILARNANTKPKRMRALEVAAGESFSF